MSATQAPASTASLGKKGGKKDKKGEASTKAPPSKTGPSSLDELIVQPLNGAELFSYVKAPKKKAADKDAGGTAEGDGMDVDEDDRAPFGDSEFWGELVKCLPADKAKRAVWVFEHLADLESDRSVDLQRHVLRIITPGRRPSSEKMDFFDDDVTRYYRRGNEDVLGENLAGFRNEGIDFAVFGAAPRIWPPPLAIGITGRHGASFAESSSACWEAVFPADPTKEELLTLMSKMSSSHATMFRAYTAQGLPTRKFFLRSLGSDRAARASMKIPVALGTASVDVEFVWAPRCSVCLNLTSSSVGHEHAQCPFVGTINKVRKQHKMCELYLEDGSWERVDSEVERNLGEELDEMAKLVKALRADVDNLVKSMPKKRKADDAPTTTPPAKKTKEAPATGSVSDAPPKKAKGKKKDNQ